VSCPWASHCNVGKPHDGMAIGVMPVAISVQRWQTIALLFQNNSVAKQRKRIIY